MAFNLIMSIEFLLSVIMLWYKYRAVNYIVLYYIILCTSALTYCHTKGSTKESWIFPRVPPYNGGIWQFSYGGLSANFAEFLIFDRFSTDFYIVLYELKLNFVLYCTTLYYTILYYIVAVLYNVVLYCTIYCIIVYYIVLYYIV